MNSSRHETAARAAPPLPPAAGSSAYTRFIPREELRSFAAWRPGSFGQAQDLAPAPWAPPASAMAPVRGASDPRHGDMQAGLAGVPSAALAVARAPLTQPQPDPDTAAQTLAPAEPAANLPTLEELHAEMQAEMQQQVAAARTQGYQDGYRDGLVALENFKQTFAQQATSQIGTLLDAFDEQLAALDGEMSQALARTAVLLAQQVLRCELTQRPELVAQVASEAVNAVMLSARHISVHVHPQDLHLVAEGAEEALAARGARLQADAALERGGVLVQSDVGAIDARIAARWAQAAAALGSQLPMPSNTAAPAGEAP